MSQQLFGLAGVVLGWALGFFSARAVDWIRNMRGTAAIKKAVLIEMDELAYRLLVVAFRLESGAGRLDTDLLTWMLSGVKRYAGPNRIEPLPDGMQELTQTTPEQLAEVNAMFRARAKSAFIPAEDAPYSSSALAQAHHLKPQFALGVMDVVSHLRMYNEARQNALTYTFMTFQPGLDEANHARVTENVDAAERSVSRQARIIVDKIAALQDAHGQS
jgi:hypothetical protein